MLQLIGELIGPLATVVVIVAIIVISGIKILREYQRAVVFRLGRMVAARCPGIIYVIPFVEKMLRVDLRTVTMDVPPEDVITRDNVSVKVTRCSISESWTQTAQRHALTLLTKSG